ncbi:MAG: tetratricopeptide repeat protein [Chitinivibrionales bacterium]
MSKPTHKKPTKIIQPQGPNQWIKFPSVRLIKRDLILGFLLFVVTLAAYQPAWNGKPIWDDDHHITRPDLRSTTGLARIWTQLGATQQYYPIVHSVFWFEYHLWGNSTLGYHLVNILLHFFSALLLVCILRRLAIHSAWFIAAIFALHPVQVESVAWITELKNTLSGVFFLSAALVYLKFDSERKRKPYVMALCLFILGLMSKSVIATLPVSLLVVCWWKRGKIDWKNDVVPLLPFFVIGIAYGLFTAWVENKFIGAQGSDFTFTFVERGLIAGRAIWFYLYKIFLPFDLIFIYPRWNVSQAVWWQYLFPIAALILVGLLWTLRQRWRAPLAAFLFFAATLFPVLGFFNVYPFRYSFVADHFQYLACIGPIALAAGIGSKFILLKGKTRLMLCVIILLILSALTWKQCWIYSDASTLFRATTQKNPGCWLAYNNLGVLQADSGHNSEAMAYYRRALELKPDYDKAHTNLGIVLAESGQTKEAMDHYRKALEANPYHDRAHTYLGILLAENGHIDEAIYHFRKAYEIMPENIGALKNLAEALIQKGQQADAIPLLQKALALAKAAGDESMVREITLNLDRLNKMMSSVQQGPR